MGRCSVKCVTCGVRERHVSRTSRVLPRCQTCESARQSRYYRDNHDQVSRRHTEYAEENRERKRGYLREYYQSHREDFYARVAIRRSRKLGLPCERVTVREVAARDGAHCWMCGDELSEYDPAHLDHLIPLSASDDQLAGWKLTNPGTVLANMSLACPSCNLSKGAQIVVPAVTRYLRNASLAQVAA